MTIRQTLSGVLPKSMRRTLLRNTSKTLAFNKTNRKDINNTKGKMKERVRERKKRICVTATKASVHCDGDCCKKQPRALQRGERCAL
jgi:hypothetical protein